MWFFFYQLSVAVHLTISLLFWVSLVFQVMAWSRMMHCYRYVNLSIFWGNCMQQSSIFLILQNQVAVKAFLFECIPYPTSIDTIKTRLFSSVFTRTEVAQSYFAGRYAKVLQGFYQSFWKCHKNKSDFLSLRNFIASSQCWPRGSAPKLYTGTQTWWCAVYRGHFMSCQCHATPPHSECHQNNTWNLKYTLEAV